MSSLRKIALILIYSDFCVKSWFLLNLICYTFVIHTVMYIFNNFKILHKLNVMYNFEQKQQTFVFISFILFGLLLKDFKINKREENSSLFNLRIIYVE